MIAGSDASDSRTRSAVRVGCGTPPRSTSPMRWYSCHFCAASRSAQHDLIARSASGAASSPSISEEISWVMTCSCSCPASRARPFFMGLQPRWFVVTRLCRLMRLPTLVLARPELGAQLFRHRLASPEDPRPDRADRAIHDLRDLLVGETV